MALRNITNNTNFLKTKLINTKQNNNKNLKQNNQCDVENNRFINIEQLTCSPSKKKLQYHHHQQQQQVQQRTSSPIIKQQQQQQFVYVDQQNCEMFKIKTNSASIKTLKHNQQRDSRKQTTLSQYPSTTTTNSRTTSRSKSTSTSENKLSSKCNGMLKVALYNNCGLLTVHIIQARNLRLPNGERLDTYARVTMLPDYEQRLKCQTTIIKDSKNPIFDEKFSFEFDENDFGNRLLISIWSKNPLQAPCSTLNPNQQIYNDYLIGCFSFKIKHLMKRDNMNVCSWYYLLPTYELGSSKHYKVKLSRNYNLNIMQQQQQQQLTSNVLQQNNDKIKSQHKIQQQQVLTDINKDIIGLTKIRFCIERNEITNDFGFTISGNSPCIISKVDPEKQAFVKGLRPGDYIVKIHDINVSRATCESVVKLIKNCKSRLIIEVYREKATTVRIVDEKPIVNKKHANKLRQQVDRGAYAQYINQIYFNHTNSSSAADDSTDGSTSVSVINTDYSGKSIDLPQYNLKMYSTRRDQDNTTGTNATTDNDSIESNIENMNRLHIDEKPVHKLEEPKQEPVDDDEEEDDDNEFFSNLVSNQIELNEIPFVDESEEADDDNVSEYDNNNDDENDQIIQTKTAQYYEQNTKLCKSRNIDCLFIKNEARTRTPMIATDELDIDQHFI